MNPIRAFLKLRKRHRRIMILLECLAAGFVAALLFTTFIAQSYHVTSSSMMPTLEEGDHVLAWKCAFWFAEPEAGDIVVFRPPEAIYASASPHYIKRVAGPPGRTLELVQEPGDNPRFGHIYIDGARVNEPRWIAEHAYAMFVKVSEKAGYAEFQKVRVPEDEVYVFGDNTLESSDSRVWGGVPLENLEGRAFYRWWPVGRMGELDAR